MSPTKNQLPAHTSSFGCAQGKGESAKTVAKCGHESEETNEQKRNREEGAGFAESLTSVSLIWR
jgi:hypothetical protein